jgi:hypothetical protein
LPEEINKGEKSATYPGSRDSQVLRRLTMKKCTNHHLKINATKISRKSNPSEDVEKTLKV